MNTTQVVETGSKAIKDHGLSVVFACALLGAFMWQSYQQAETSKSQSQRWQELRETDLGGLRDELKTEREFVRGKLTETLESNSEATRLHTTAIKELTEEIRRRGTSD